MTRDLASKHHSHGARAHRARFAFEPDKSVVLATAGITAGLLLTVAGSAVAASHATLTLEVDGVSQPVEVWGGTVATVLNRAGVEVSEHDLVQPNAGQPIADGQQIIVRTAHPHSLVIDGKKQTIWSTSSSADTILADASILGADVALTADRSTMRASLTPLVARSRMVAVNVDGTEHIVQAYSGDDATHILARSGIELHPNDRVDVTADGETGMTITVTRVERGEIVVDVPVDFESTTTSSDALFEGESQITQQGVAGVAAQSQWQESVDGVVTKNVTTAQHVVTAPVDEVRTNGTKPATPEALVQAGIDPKSPLETSTDANGASQTKYSAALGSLSSAEEITAIINGMTDQNEKLTAAAAAQSAGLTITYTGQDPKEIAQIMVTSRGWSAAEYQCLVNLWNRESRWNPYAENPSSGAYGIPQSLPGSKMASAGADWRTNPATQITWGLGYIAGRYGTPCSAWAHSNSVGWY